MKNAIYSIAGGIALALTSGIASAGDAGVANLHERLTRDEGLHQISDGLYAESSDSGESFVATNAKGRAALAEKIRTLQPQAQLFTYAGTGHAFNRDVDPKVYDDNAATLAWQRTREFLETQLR